MRHTITTLICTGTPDQLDRVLSAVKPSTAPLAWDYEGQAPAGVAAPVEMLVAAGLILDVNVFEPMPIGMLTGYGDAGELYDQGSERMRRLAMYGAGTWQDWQAYRWGCRGLGCGVLMEVEDAVVRLRFQSVGAPGGAVSAIQRTGVTVAGASQSRGGSVEWGSASMAV